MQLTVATTAAELAALAPGWDALADAVDAPALARPFFCIPWAAHSAPATPMVLAVREGSRLVGLAPLQQQRVAGCTLVRFLGHGLGTVSDLLVAPDRPDVRDALWRAITGGRARFAQLLELRAGPQAAPTSVAHVVEPRDRCLVVDCPGSFEDYLAARSKKLRENLRRAERSVEGRGAAHVVEVVTTPERWSQVRSEVLGVWDAAEAARPRQHLLRDHHAAFTEELLHTSATTGHLRVFVGRLDGAPVSFGLAFVTPGCLSYWVTRFDPAHAASSVGVLLLRDVIAQGFQEGMERVDLMLGDTEPKRRFATSGYETLTALAASSRSLLACGRVALAAAARARR